MEAILGIVGTLLGTVLGWLLARWNIGKLYISLDSFEEKIYRLDGAGGIAQIETGEFLYAELNFIIHLYNSFPITRAIRECELVFLDSADSELTRMPISDEGSRHVYAHAVHYDSVGIVNLDGYTSKDIKAQISINDIDLLHKVSKIEFHYKNEKRKEKVLPYKKIDFSSVSKIGKKTTDEEG